MLTRRLLVLGALLAVTGCRIDSQSPPDLTGPSELGLALSITATPDAITQDGQSQATIDIVARDGRNQPIRGLTLQAQIFVGGVAADFGALSSKTISTNNEGKAVLIYRAPAEPPPSVGEDTTVTIGVTPVGTDYASALPRTVQIRLTRPGVILPPNGTPVPSFFYSPTAPREEDSVLFDASASTDSDGQIVAYKWSFGDGGTASGVRVNHTFGLAGEYSVILTVTDDRGTSATSQPKTVSVGSLAGPKADFTFSPTVPLVNQAINFNGSASAAAAGRQIAAYDWDFGDGSGHGSGVTTQHSYSVEGSYTVVLKVVDDTGRSAVLSKNIVVGVAAPKADFNISPPTAKVNVTVVQFSSVLSTAPPGRTLTAYAWDFGDGTSSTAANPTHMYTLTGTFTVVLQVTDNTGAIGVASKSISVTP